MGKANKAVTRKAEEKDAGSISRLIKKESFMKSGKGNLLPLKKKDIVEAIRNSAFYVAELDKKIAACCSVIEYGGIAELRSLVVGKKHRGKGLGTAAADACIKEAKRRGYKKLYALTQAEGFFTKLGFEKTGVPPEKMIKYCKNCPLKDNCVEISFVRVL